MKTKSPRKLVRKSASRKPLMSRKMLGSRRAGDGPPVSVGSSNVFKDLNRPDGDEAFAKMELAFEINKAIESLELNQTQAATLLGTDRARISNLARGQLKEFSLSRLFDFLNALGRDVSVTVGPIARTRGRLNVIARAG